jgi:hypothetical protein
MVIVKPINKLMVMRFVELYGTCLIYVMVKLAMVRYDVGGTFEK